MRATIKMIAERAGVSIGTVDRVLHNRPYVKEEVRERVLRVMEELDYRPNRMASALALSGTRRHFAVVQPEWDPYVEEEMAAGVALFWEERRDYNLTVTVERYPMGDSEACVRLLERLAEEGVQGVALCASDCPRVRQRVAELRDGHVPVVTFNSDISGGARLCYVGENAHHAGRLAGEIVSKFVRAGDRTMMVYSGPAYAGHKGRADGFLERMEELGLQREDCRVAATREDYQKTRTAVTEALQAEPELRYIYMANASVRACMEALKEQGMLGRIRVLAHDNSPEIQTYLREGALDFTIGQNLRYQSWKALSVLFDAVLEQHPPEQEYFYPDSPVLTSENC